MPREIVFKIITIWKWVLLCGEVVENFWFLTQSMFIKIEYAYMYINYVKIVRFGNLLENCLLQKGHDKYSLMNKGRFLKLKIKLKYKGE